MPLTTALFDRIPSVGFATYAETVVGEPALTTLLTAAPVLNAGITWQSLQNDPSVDSVRFEAVAVEGGVTHRQSVTVQATDLAEALELRWFDGGDGLFRLSGRLGPMATDDFSYSATDWDQWTVRVVGINHSFDPANLGPTWLGALTAINYIEGDTPNFDVSGDFSDPEGDPITYTATGLPTGLTISSAGVISGTVALPAGGFPVSIIATDSRGAATTVAAFSMTVTALNLPPVHDGTAFGPFNYNEGATIALITGATGFSDPEGDTLTYSTAPVLPAGLSINPTTGDITGTVAIGSPANISWQVSANDGQGNSTLSQAMLLLINRTPTLTGDAPASLPFTEGEAAPVVSVVDWFGDPDGDTLTYSIPGGPAGIVISPTGDISGTPGPGTAGSPTIAIRATDPDGLFVDESIQLVIAANLPPVHDGTVLGPFAYNEGGVIAAIAGATGFSDPEGQALTYATSVALPTGLVINSTTGQITGTVALGAPASATFRVLADDGINPPTQSEEIVLNINRTPTSTPITDLSVTVDVAMPNFDISGSFSDPDGDTLTYLISTGALPTGLDMNTSTGVIFGTPVTVAPAVTIGYRAWDGILLSPEQTFTVTVTAAANLGPDPTSTIPDMALFEYDTVNTDIVTSAAFVDPEGNTPFAYSATGLPAGLVLNSTTGVLSGSPDPSTGGTEASGGTVYAVQVFATDSLGQIGAPATITITITDLAPTTSGIADFSATEAEAMTPVDVSGAFTDPEGAVLTFGATGLPAGLTMSVSGVISGTATAGTAAGSPYSVTVIAIDPASNFVEDTFTLTVDPVPTFTVGDLDFANAQLWNGANLDFITTPLPEQLSFNSPLVIQDVAGIAGLDLTIAYDKSLTFDGQGEDLTIQAVDGVALGPVNVTFTFSQPIWIDPADTDFQFVRVNGSPSLTTTGDFAGGANIIYGPRVGSPATTWNIEFEVSALSAGHGIRWQTWNSTTMRIQS